MDVKLGVLLLGPLGVLLLGPLGGRASSHTICRSSAFCFSALSEASLLAPTAPVVATVLATVVHTVAATVSAPVLSFGLGLGVG